MKIIDLALIFIFGILALHSCSTIDFLDRMPQSASIYEPYKVELLKNAADHKVLFQFSDSVYKDVSSKQVADSCKSTGEAAWVTEAYEVLDLFKNNPKLYSKVHVIELRRGDKPQIEINKDLDGAVYLALSYSKTEVRREIKSLSDIPCESQTMNFLGKEISEVQFEWPSREKISTQLLTLSDRPHVARFEYDSGFLKFLADRQIIFRMTPDLAFEKSVEGKPLLSEVLKDLSEKTNKSSSKAFDFWMREISMKSLRGLNLKILVLKKDAELNHGLAVQSQGAIQRKIQGVSEPTYPYVSYRLDSGKFSFASFDKLESCLSKLNPTGMGLDKSSESFLFPGYHCH